MTNRGFTLLEMMITVAIVAVLVSISVPLYARYQTAGKQAQAQALLADLKIRAERYRGEEDAYPPADSDLRLIGMSVDANNRSTTPPFYTLRMLSSSDVSFEASAAANIDTDPHMDEWRIDQSDCKPWPRENDYTDVSTPVKDCK